MIRKTKIYEATDNIESPVIEKDIDFDFTNGYYRGTKTNNMKSLKKVCIENGYKNSKLLEISTVSDNDFGKKLSALNLNIKLNSGKFMTVEEIYQISKKSNKGHIEYFEFGGRKFQNEPKTMYYDYIYMLALYTHKEYWEYLENYRYFTDVFFNRERQINTQARAAAIFKTFLGNTDYLGLLENSNDFKEYYKGIKILKKTK